MNIKKIVCVALAVLCVSAVIVDAKPARTQPNALGLRLGGGSLSGAELNYQKGLNANRLELGASLGFNSYDGGRWYDNYGVPRYNWQFSETFIGVIGFYQWHFNIANIRGFNWYVGPGAGAEYYSWSRKYYDNRSTESDGGIGINAGGQIGIEYDFNAIKVPLIISLDLRWMLKLLGGLDDWHQAGLGIRYTWR